MINKRGQFYFMATIVIIGLIAGIALTFNYSKKTNFYEVEEIAEELTIEGKKVIDYDTLHSSNEQFENFAKDYSAYVGEDKKIYFIIIDGATRKAYNYTNGVQNDLSANLMLVGEEIHFILDEENYVFKLEEGKNFYFILIYEKKEERYVFSG